MKRILIPLLALLIMVSPTYGAQLWEYASFGERAEIATDLGLVDSPSEYTGDQETNLALLEYFSGDENFGAAGGLPVTDYQTTLTVPLTSSATTINVASVTTIDDHVLTTSDIDPAVYLVLEPDSSNKKEIIKCTTITSLTFTGCTRGLAFYGTSEAAVTANQKSHSAGTTVVLSNVHFYYVSPSQTQTWSALQTFSAGSIHTASTSFELLPYGYDAPTTTFQLANKAYVDGVAQQGAATSTEATGGLVELATAAEIALGAALVANSPLAIGSYNATSTPSGTSSAANRVVVSESDGLLNQLWFDLTELWAFAGGLTANQATTTELVIGSTVPTAELATGDLFLGNDLIVTGNATATNATTTGSLYITDDLEIASELTFNMLHSSTTDAGVIAAVSGTATANTDEVITVGFRPKVIVLDYFLQGHTQSTGTNQYQRTRGEATYEGTTQVWGRSFTCDDSGSDATSCTALSSGVSAPGTVSLSVGQATSGDNDILATLSILSISDTGFTIRCAFDTSTGSAGTTGRCAASYTAYR